MRACGESRSAPRGGTGKCPALLKSPLRPVILGTALLGAVFLSGCIQFEREEEPGGNTRLSGSAVLFSQGEWINAIVSVDTADLTFTFFEGYDLGLGDVIVSAAGSGYLRKVTGVRQTTGGVEVTTTGAALTDVVEWSDTAFTIRLTPDMIEGTTYLKKGASVELMTGSGTLAEPLNYNISTTLGDGSAGFTGVLNLEASLTLGWKIVDYTIESVSAGLELSQHLELVSVLAPGEGTAGEEQICIQTFKPFVVWAGLPVVVVPELELRAGIAASANTGMELAVTGEMDLTADVAYAVGEWSGSGEHLSVPAMEEVDLLSDISAVAYLRPLLKFRLYNAPLLAFSSEPFFEMAAARDSVPWWTLFAGDTAILEVDPVILDPGLPDYATDPPLLAFRDTVTAAVQPWIDPTPLAGFTADATTIQAGDTVLFTDLSTNDPTGWLWDFGDGDTSALQHPAHAFVGPGSYDVTLVASNAFGSDTAVKLDFITVVKLPGRK